MGQHFLVRGVGRWCGALGLTLALVAASPSWASADPKPAGVKQPSSRQPERAADAKRRRATEARLRAQRARQAHARLMRKVAAQVAAIDHFCDRLADVSERPEQRRLFALWSEADRAWWVEYDDPKNLEWALKNRPLIQVAELWTRDDGATALALSLAGSDRAWTSFVDYCFRSDGTLARMEAPRDVTDADPAFRRLARRHFTTAGASLGETKFAWLRSFPAYLTPAELPFASLVRSEAQASR